MNSQALEPEVESASSTTTQRRASVIPFRSEEHGRFGVEAFAVAILIFSVSMLKPWRLNSKMSD